MATYQDLFDLGRNQIILDKVTVAIQVTAAAIYDEADTVTNHANRIIWAREAVLKPRAMALVLISPVLIANKSASVADIISASDTAIQTNIDDVIDDFADGTAVLI